MSHTSLWCITVLLTAMLAPVGFRASSRPSARTREGKLGLGLDNLPMPERPCQPGFPADDAFAYNRSCG
jgi:hypothetical protein